jgi:4-amino-4-deoxy-L-arabinose transferase-like glycosyltransferase
MQVKSLVGSCTVLALCLLWIAFGLTGHEPWKPDEGYTFGLVLHILQTGDWVIPTLAGEPFMEKPPLFFITAALFAKCFGGWLPLHDAARLATGFYLALTVALIHLTAKATGDQPGRRLAPLLFISCIGLFELSHRLQTDISLMAGTTLSLYALALMPRRAALGGILMGTGTGIAFLSKGLIGPGLIGLVTLALLSFPHWRNATYFKSWLWAIAAGLPWLLVWPLLLYQRSPEQFEVWFWTNNIGRFIGSGLGPASEPWYYTKTLTWFAWPALPLALWGAWKSWRSENSEWLHSPALQLSLAAFVVMLAALGSAGDSRSNYALPLLPPLALLGSLGVQHIKAKGQSLWYWSGVGLFGLLSLVLWLGWIGMQLDAPAIWAQRLQTLEPGYVSSLRPGAMLIALLMTALGFYILRQTRANPHRAAWSWATGMTLTWGLYCQLWLPFVDYGRSYRDVLTELGQQLDPRQCLTSRGLGEPQRALLDYYAQTKSQRLEVLAQSSCPQLLITEKSPEVPSADWHLVWQGTRHGDDREYFHLYRHP